MILNRGKQSKSEAPTRPLQATGRISPILIPNKKSDPFLRDLREVYDKQNINPNLKENRTKSYNLRPENHNRLETHVDQRSPSKKPIIAPKNIHRNTTVKPREEEGLGSHSKSSELQKVNKSKDSNRKSTEKDQLLEERKVQQQEEYFPLREERREKKMKVTLKDLKRHRRSIQDSQGQYQSRPNANRQSIFLDSIGKLESTKAQLLKNQPENVTVHVFDAESKQELQPQFDSQEIYCLNHPEKRASHTLDGAPKTGYCQRCAVILATKGHRMNELNEQGRRRGGVKEQRIGELKDFLFELDKTEPLVKRALHRVASQKSFLLTKMQQQSKKLDIYYQNICTVIKNSYDSAMATLKLHYDAVLQEIDQRVQLVEKNGRQMDDLKEDILLNISSIIEIAKVSNDAFKGVIDHNYAKIAEISRVMQQVCSLACNYYEHRFQNVEHSMIELHTMISPILEAQTIDPAFETDRKLTSASDEWLDPFRMSFGKNCGSGLRI